MKTVKEHLKTVDRQRLLDCLSFRLLSDPLQLLEMKDCTVQEIRDRYSRYMSAFIDRLLVTEAERADSHVFYLYTDYKTGETLDLIKLEEVTEDIEASGYDFSSMEWGKSLGYSVADTKLTQDNLTELLAQYLEGASFFGTDEESRAANISELEKRIEDGLQSAREGHGRPAREVFDELAREHGFPVPEKDPRQDELRSQVVIAMHEYGMYSKRKERKRILASIAKV